MFVIGKFAMVCNHVFQSTNLGGYIDIPSYVLISAKLGTDQVSIQVTKSQKQVVPGM